VLNVILFGVVASSALVIGAVAGAYWTPPKPLLASALAFASGALITALAFDLFQESFERGGAWLSAIGVVGSPNLVEVVFSEVRMAPVQCPRHPHPALHCACTRRPSYPAIGTSSLAVLAHHDLGYAAIHPRILDAVVHNHRKRLFSKKGHRGFPIRATTSEACLITRAV